MQGKRWSCQVTSSVFPQEMFSRLTHSMTLLMTLYPHAYLVAIRLRSENGTHLESMNIHGGFDSTTQLVLFVGIGMLSGALAGLLVLLSIRHCMSWCKTGPGWRYYDWRPDDGDVSLASLKHTRLNDFATLTRAHAHTHTHTPNKTQNVQ